MTNGCFGFIEKISKLHRKVIECIYHIENHPLIIIIIIIITVRYQKNLSSSTQIVPKACVRTDVQKETRVHRWQFALLQPINRSKRINTINRSQVALKALSLSQYIIITVVTNIEKYTYALKQSVGVALRCVTLLCFALRTIWTQRAASSVDIIRPCEK